MSLLKSDFLLADIALVAAFIEPGLLLVESEDVIKFLVEDLATIKKRYLALAHLNQKLVEIQISLHQHQLFFFVQNRAPSFYLQHRLGYILAEKCPYL